MGLSLGFSTRMHLLFWSLLFASASSQHQERTPAWVNICGGTYLFSEDRKTWDGAIGECELYESHLVQIDSFAENVCLLDYAHTADVGHISGAWHSANDHMSEGVWRQYDGTLLSWAPMWSTIPLQQGELMEEQMKTVLLLILGL